MLLEQQIRDVYEYQKEYYTKLSTGTPRKTLGKIDLDNYFIKVLTGVRRCGKSTLMLQLAGKQKSVNFLSFEDPRLSQFEVNDFFKLEKIFEENKKSSVYFIDEIQNVEGWERFIRVLHDKKTKVVISGSNADLLSKELGTKLTGRQITYELFPFSYAEFLVHTKLKGGLASFQRFLFSGGFPEYVTTTKLDVLIHLYNDIIFRDIVVRHGLRNSRVIRDIGVYFASNIGKEFSYNKLAVNFELGSVNTIQSYVSYFEDAYLFFTVPRFSFSLKQQAKNQKKVYGVDTGLITNLSLSFSKDIGRLLENAVFIAFRRMGKKIYYYKNTGECDFVVTKGGYIEHLVQVCYELNSDNLQRETKGLLDAMNVLNKTSGLILTMDQTDRILEGNKIIEVLPVWQWLLKSD